MANHLKNCPWGKPSKKDFSSQAQQTTVAQSTKKIPKRNQIRVNPGVNPVRIEAQSSIKTWARSKSFFLTHCQGEVQSSIKN